MRHRRRTVGTYNFQRTYYYRRRYTFFASVHGSLEAGGKTPSELASEIEIFPQVLVNAKINNDYKKTYMKDPQVAKAISDVERELAQDGRLLIRPSGTEPLVRVMVEGSDRDRLTVLAGDLAKLIEEKFR